MTEKEILYSEWLYKQSIELQKMLVPCEYLPRTIKCNFTDESLKDMLLFKIDSETQLCKLND